MDASDFATFQEKVRGTNISEHTLLATDYLNHFNEVVMVLEMVADFPDALEDVKAWQPLSYVEHFRNSHFSDKDLAIAAYEHVPPNFRRAFETTVDQINQLIAAASRRLERIAGEGDTEKLRHEASEASKSIQKLMDVASAIIHGSEVTMDQSEIDSLLRE